jgi:hypothetical protein
LIYKMNEYKISWSRESLINFLRILIKSSQIFIQVLFILRIFHLKCKSQVIRKIIWFLIKLLKIKFQNLCLILKIFQFKMLFKTLWQAKIHYLDNTLIQLGLDFQKPSPESIILKLFSIKLQADFLTLYNLT